MRITRDGKEVRTRGIWNKKDEGQTPGPTVQSDNSQKLGKGHAACNKYCNA